MAYPECPADDPGTQWINETLLPMEHEWGMNFYFWDRDSLAGMSVIYELLTAIENSEKILFVVSDMLFAEHRYHLEVVVHAAVDKGFGSIILCIVDEQLLNSNSLSRGFARLVLDVQRNYPGHYLSVQHEYFTDLLLQAIQHDLNRDMLC